jgi:hypothetical protein
MSVGYYRWGAYVAQRLGELDRGEGDFTGLQRPGRDTIRRANFVATALFAPTTPTPSVVPGEEGEVCFVWHKAGWSMQITVPTRPGQTRVWAYRAATETTFSGPMEEFRAIIMKVFGDMGG